MFKRKYTSHALQRMFERNIKIEEVEELLDASEIIKEYPNDEPYPSVLKMGMVNNRPIHVLFAENKNDKEIYIITVYVPGNEIWENDFKRKKIK